MSTTHAGYGPAAIKEIGSRVRIARHTAGLEQAQLAEQVRALLDRSERAFSHAKVSNIELGKKTDIGVLELKAISEVTGADLDWLMGAGSTIPGIPASRAMPGYLRLVAA